MKWIKRIIYIGLIILILNFVFVPNKVKQLKPIEPNIKNFFSLIKTNFVSASNTIISNINSISKKPGNTKTRASLSSTTTSSKNKINNTLPATPSEGIITGKQLSKTYYYSFKQNTPVNIKNTFKQAIKKYNQTGLVKIKPKNANQTGNQITFYIYYKKTNNPQSIELGHGGPQIYQYYGLKNYTKNQGQAGLNLQYPSLSIKLSVAMHELGHALGLDHNINDQNSIMYPVEKNKTNLTPQDIQGLKNIYAKKNR